MTADVVEATVSASSSGAELPALTFVRPLPGFPELSSFALVRLDHADSGDEAESDDSEAAEGESAEDEDLDPVVFELRSLEAPDVRFLVAAPNAFFPDYSFELDQDAQRELGLSAAEDALVLVVLTVGADAASTTANLLAPVVVNARNRSAAQVILSGTDWPVRAAVV
ncbi:MAG: flagellar assembly protein FliW [Kineosporiaceae bacterium]|nr:flagellar assembly protein FliW [Kineosporiaceae bacterium]MBK7622156.1 flagellar assembly protein FliW [Kineosporiaceae bacterium]MBK8074467.1 flagellar assembly protein FliW [Kineosporiaceae bacterium]